MQMYILEGEAMSPCLLLQVHQHVLLQLMLPALSTLQHSDWMDTSLAQNVHVQQRIAASPDMH